MHEKERVTQMQPSLTCLVIPWRGILSCSGQLKENYNTWMMFRLNGWGGQGWRIGGDHLPDRTGLFSERPRLCTRLVSERWGVSEQHSSTWIKVWQMKLRLWHVILQEIVKNSSGQKNLIFCQIYVLNFGFSCPLLFRFSECIPISDYIHQQNTDHCFQLQECP